MEKEINIYEYGDGTVAVAVNENDGYHLMLKQWPNFLGVIDQRHKDELFKFLLNKEIKKGKEIVL